MWEGKRTGRGYRIGGGGAGRGLPRDVRRGVCCVSERISVCKSTN